jgi:ribose transport system permease protein
MSATQPPDPVAGDPVVAGDAVTAEAIAAPRARLQRRIKAEHIRDYGIVVFAIVLFIYFSIASSVFLTKNNLLNLVFQNATIGVAACAVTLTIIAGNFDLSLGSIFVLAEVLAAWAGVHIGVWWAFPMAIVSGAAMGLINCLLVAKVHINAFLATLATALTFGGIAVGVSNVMRKLGVLGVSNVMRKLGVHSRAEAAYAAGKRGLLDQASP